jgi:hypothetical protein
MVGVTGAGKLEFGPDSVRARLSAAADADKANGMNGLSPMRLVFFGLDHDQAIFPRPAAQLSRQ